MQTEAAVDFKGLVLIQSANLDDVWLYTNSSYRASRII